VDSRGAPPISTMASAASLRDVVDFDDLRFALHLSDGQKADLVAFLRAL